MLNKIKSDAALAINELIETSGIRSGEIMVIGCSSSELTGGTIGKASAPEAAEALLDAVYPILKEKGIFLAAQCCEHLNRAIIIERECAKKYQLDEVCVVPQPKAGGSFATAVYKRMSDPVAVEAIKAHAGIDIGSTLIGMHLRCVAVPVRLSLSKIGEANIVCARTRPKYIGGERAKYE
ncbi:MAG: TIGR01440 family protein [Clostridia bacterium]|nr:TIGR01440 family protein [Clostridia bacterium]